MSPPAGWQNPITAQPGQIQSGVDARLLLPSRPHLLKARLDLQRALLQAGRERLMPIQVTSEGVIWDGHHAVRAAAEDGRTVQVVVIDKLVQAVGTAILDLPVR